jgi:hypothetical protein
MLKNSNNYWKELPVKLPPLSYMQHTGEKVWQSQHGVNLLGTCVAVLLSTLISSIELEAVSMQVKALNSTFLPLILTSQGPIRSMVTSSQGATHTSFLGSSPYPQPGILYFQQSWHISFSMCWHYVGWW